MSLLCCPTVYVGPVLWPGARTSISDSSAVGQMSRGAEHGHASTAHSPWTRNTTRHQHSPPPSIVGRLRAVIWGRRLATTGMRRLSPASAESAAAAVRLARSHECGYGRQRNLECAVLSSLLLHIACLGIQDWYTLTLPNPNTWYHPGPESHPRLVPCAHGYPHTSSCPPLPCSVNIESPIVPRVFLRAYVPRHVLNPLILTTPI